MLEALFLNVMFLEGCFVLLAAGGMLLACKMAQYVWRYDQAAAREGRSVLGRIEEFLPLKGRWLWYPVTLLTVMLAYALLMLALFYPWLAGQQRDPNGGEDSVPRVSRVASTPTRDRSSA